MLGPVQVETSSPPLVRSNIPCWGLGGVPVASLKVYTTPEHLAGIYAFCVVPPHRRRGYASQFLRRVASALAAEGYGRIWLEVDSDNDPAIALYRSVGFHHTTTYGYYRLALSHSARPRTWRLSRHASPASSPPGLLGARGAARGAVARPRATLPRSSV